MPEQIKKIIWTEKGLSDFEDTLQYFIIRNKSDIYSVKLVDVIIKSTQDIQSNNSIGKVFRNTKYRFVVVDNYKLFYEITSKNIIVHYLFDTRRNPKSIRKLLTES